MNDTINRSKLTASPNTQNWPEQLAVRVAKCYYELSMTQQEIAKEVGIGRARVIRLLAEARERGIVTIRINSPLLENVELAQSLASKFNLDFVEVCLSTGTDDDQLAKQIASAAGPAISRILRDDMTIGLGWGATLKEFATHFEPLPLNGISVVSLLGSLTRRSSVIRFEATTELAAKLNAECLYLPAPIVCDSIHSREILVEQPIFKSIFEKALQSDLAIVSIGGLNCATICNTDMVSVEENNDTCKQGAVGNFLGYYINSCGEVVSHPVNDRIIGIRGEDFVSIPKRIMISGGVNKFNAIKAVLEKGLLTGLVTDQQTARSLIE